MGIVCLSYFIIILEVESKSIGFVETAGIRYSDISTGLNSENIGWNEIGKQATLKIEVTRVRATSVWFTGDLKLQRNGQPLPFNIRFNIDGRQYPALIEVLNLLKGKNIQVVTIVEDTTSGDEDRSKIIDEIKKIAEEK